MKELIDKFKPFLGVAISTETTSSAPDGTKGWKAHRDWSKEYYAKQCAIIALEHTIEALKEATKGQFFSKETQLIMEAYGDNPCNFTYTNPVLEKYQQQLKELKLNSNS